MTLTLNLIANREIQQYADYSVEFEIPDDLTGATQMQAALRRRWSQDVALLLEVQVLRAAAPARVRLRLSRSQTSLLLPDYYRWDLIVVINSAVTRLAQGNAAVRSGVAHMDASPTPPPAPPSGNTPRFSDPLPAATALSALRAVRILSGHLVYASSDDLAPYSVLGILPVAASAAESVAVQIDGSISDSSWSWVAGWPIFLGLAGGLTQAAPETGLLIKLADVLSPTQIQINIEETTVL